MLLRTAILVVLGTAIGHCGRKLPPVGYGGPIPSGSAQRTLGGLDGRTIVLAQGGMPWTIAWFAVVPNPATGLGPVVCLEQATSKRYVPLPTDAEVADFVARVDGRTEVPSSALDAAYRAALAIP